MRILIDECLDWRLCRALNKHDCSSVQKMGWGGLTNGALLEQAEKKFDVFVTVDRNLGFQQNVSSFHIAVVVLHADSTQLSHTLTFMPELLSILPNLESGKVVSLGSDHD